MADASSVLSSVPAIATPIESHPAALPFPAKRPLALALSPALATSPAVASREGFLARLAAAVGAERLARCLGTDTRVVIAAGRIEVIVGTTFRAQLLERQLGPDLRVVAAQVLGTPADPAVVIRVDPGLVGRDPDMPKLVSASRGDARRAPRAASGTGESVPTLTLAGTSNPAPGVRPAPRREAATPHHRLEDFVVGATNQLAYSAAVRLAEDETTSRYSPLFVHGRCGVGKTHLLQGIARRAAEIAAARGQRVNIRCQTAESFTNEFIMAVKANKVDAFRRGYRKVDLLCLDDVHFLSSKEATQAELLHTFDAIGLDGARIVLASDEHPREIKKLSAALASRFMAGAVVRIDSPDAELSAKLLHTIAARRGLTLSAESVAVLVEHAATLSRASVRELEGLVTQIEAVHRLLPDLREHTVRAAAVPGVRNETDGPATSGGVAKATAGMVGAAVGVMVGAVTVRTALGLATGRPVTHEPNRVRRPVQIGTITAEVCRTLAVEPAELAGKTRHKRVVLARAVVTWLARRLTTLSFPEIARAIGRPNHSTVITAHNRLIKQLAVARDPATREQARVALEAEIGPGFAGLTLTELVERLNSEVERAAAR